MWWRARRTQDDFHDEIRAHLELEADELMRSGMSERDARDAARRRFGNVGATEERFYESRRVMWLDRLRQDAAYALRTLRLSPVYGLTALLTLALGIGVTTTVFSLVDAIALRPLPVRDPGRVVTMYQDFRGEYSRRVQGSPSFSSLPEYVAYRDGARAFDGLAAHAGAELALSGRAAPAHVQFVSCNYFGVLRARLVAGRAFALDECADGGVSPVAVVSHGLWQRELGGDPAAVGRALRVGPRVVTVIGVAEPEFRGTEIEAPELWLPLSMHPVLLPGVVNVRDPDMGWLTVVGRLKPEVTLATARAELAVIARRLDGEHPGRVTTLHVDVGAFANEPEVHRTGLVIAGALGAVAALVLLMACVNVMSLSLSRALARRREIGVRLALGADRRRLVRQLLTESLVLALGGGVLGVALASWLPPLLVAAVPATAVRVDVGPNARVAAFAFGVALLAAVASGLAPALQATRLALTDALKGDGGVGRRGGAVRLRGRLVGAQVAGSLLLLIMSGLLLRGVARARTMDPGFATRGVVALTLDLNAASYSAERAAALYAALAERLGALPGVQSVATAQMLPLLGRGSSAVTPVGGGVAGEAVPVSLAIVSGTYLSTMGVPLVRGRSFTDAEARAGGARPVVVSAALARRVWGGREPLGARLRDPDGEYYVVGVAGDVHNVSLAERDGAFLYRPASPDDPRGMKVVVRERAAGAPAVASLAAVVAELDGSVPVVTEVFADRLARMRAPARTAATICGVIGLLATLLALVGVYGVASYNASARRREIAVRVALGASVRHVLTVVIGEGARPIVIGLAAGTLAAAGAARLARGALFGVGALDPVAFAGAIALLGGAAFLAMYRPARRAAGVEPAVVLREE